MIQMLEPLQAGTLNLKNRLVMPPMATVKAGSDGKVSDSLLDYYQEKSRGGYLGLIIIEHSYIQASGKAHENQLAADDDEVIPGLRRLAEVIHGNGVKTVMQISHAGSAASREVIGGTPVGPSAVANPRRGDLPRELTVMEINQLIDDFQTAARRVQSAGFDGVEIHSAHGYLLNQFLSPLTNQRHDEYGGDIFSRIRLHLQVIDAVRRAVGPDFPILLRLGAADYLPGGTTIEDSRIAAREFARAGVQIIDVSGGFCGYVVPGLTGQGFFAPLAEAIKEAVSIPVILTGGITEANAAEKLLAEGKADLIGVGRAIMQDSDWPRRALSSLAAQI